LSPDSRSVAFWIWDSRNKTEELAVLDTSTGKIVNYCVEGDQTERHTSGIPIWSPDGRYLIIEQVVDINQNQVIVIDTIQEKAFVILKNQIPVGWMISPQE
jgi:hypothetical protein